MSIELNAAQRDAVDARANVVVSAGAGSGKTRVLADRFVALVTSGAATVDRILTLTFTRKAAAEMFDRIHASLQAAAERDEAVRPQLAAFDQAQISTLDAFAASVLRDAAALFGIRPDFSSDTEELQRQTERMALAFVRDHADDPVVRNYLAHGGFRRTVASPFVELAMNYISLARPIGFAALFSEQCRWLEGERRTRVEALRGHVAVLRESPLQTAGVEKVRVQLGRAGDDIERLCETVASLSANVGGARSPEGSLFRENVRAAREAAATVSEIVTFLARRGELDNLARTLSSFQEATFELRRTSGTLGHGEVFDLALVALQQSAELRAYYKNRFDFIMIDEFQDNNAAQRDLLYILAERRDVAGTGVPAISDLEGDKLFFVGDQKQSIYRFRGADVSVFKTLARSFTQLSLSTNYRSDPALIDFFNSLFERLFGDATREFDAEFEALEPGREATADGAAAPGDGTAPDPAGRRWSDSPAAGATDRATGGANPPPAVRFALVEEAEHGEEGHLYDQRAEAAWIAGEIERLMETTPPGEIAILLRVGSNQQRYEQALRKRGIPYRTNALRSLFLEAPASDIYALLQLTLYPSDRAAYASLLRGPLVRLSDAALAEVLVAHGEDAPFERVPASLSDEDRRRFERGRALYTGVTATIDSVPLATLLDRIWHVWGYRYSLLVESRYATFTEHFTYLQQIARTYAGRPAAEFVDYLRENLGSARKIDDAEIPGADAVSIMTIHRSKGLEFPVVFVADCGGIPRTDTRTVWYDRRLGVTVALPDDADADDRKSPRNLIARYAAQGEAEENEAELKRLLYVAATRAERLLTFTSTARVRDGSLTAFIAGAIGYDGERRVATDPAFGDLPVVTIPGVPEREWDRVRHRGIRRNREEIDALLRTAAVNDRRPVELNFAPSALDDLSYRAGPAERADVNPRTDADPSPDPAAIGTIIHRRIQATVVPTLPPTAGEVRRDLEPEAFAIADAFVASDAWRAFLVSVADAEAEAEVPFLFYLPGEPGTRATEAYFSGAVDLLFRLPDRVVIVDFKSDARMLPEEHGTQLGIYRRAFAEIYGLPAEAYIAYVRFAALVVVESVPDDDRLRRLVGQKREL